MSILLQINPYDYFSDLCGKALDEGYVYIGEPNKDPRQYPVSVYYDDALSIPAPQPLRTNDGYVVRSGSPTFLFINGNYSILVLDKKMRQVFYVADFLLIGNALPVRRNEVPFPVPNVAALRLLDKTKYAYAQTGGYYAPGDRGSAFFWLDTTDTSSPDNGGTIIVGADGGRWKMLAGSNISIRQFGAKGDGTTDDTARIQAAVTWAGSAGGVEVFAPAGTYKMSTEVQFLQPHSRFRGESKDSTTFVQSDGTKTLFNVAANYCKLSDFSTDYSATATSGALGAIIANGQYCRYESIIIRNPYVGIIFTISPFQNATDIQVFDYLSIGIYCTMTNDIFVSQFTCRANSNSKGALGGVRLFNRCEACCFTDGEILEGQFPLTTDSTVYGFGVCPAFNTFTNCFFDSAVNAAVLSNLLETEFVGCWFSNGHPGAGASGMLLGQSDGVKFTNCRFNNCGADGARVLNSAHRFSFVNCSANGNGQVTGNAAAGYYIEGGAADFVISGSSAANNVFLGSQGYGIFLAAGSTDRFSIVDNQLANNALGAMQDNSTGNTKHIAGNVGYNPRPATLPAVGASPWTYTNNTGNTVSLNCNGGTVSLATLNGNKFAGATDFSVGVPQASSVTITYSSAPTVQVFGH